VGENAGMKLLVVEDEPLLAQRLERLSRDILGPQLESVRVASLLSEASARLDESPIDLLLLDLNLHGRDGMELLASSVAGSFHTIIVSANTDQALRAFEYGVIDFVPKPFSRERLAQALQRVIDRDGRAANAAKYLAVKKYGRVELIAIDNVLYVEGAGAYAELVLSDGKRELHDKTLERLHALLPPVFERIHKSYIVRWSAVKALHASEGSHYEAELHNGTRLPIGRSRYKELRAKFG
jgi:DNA-binding LytR/AlgR family response regulator